MNEVNEMGEEFSGCFERETDNVDVQDTSRFWELEQGGGQI